MSSDLPEIEEMSVPESAYVMWSHAAGIDTKGRCDCGHEGLGPAWHTGDCRGANAALVDKAQELTRELWDQWTSNHAEHCGDSACDQVNCRDWPLPKGLQF
jgi:hypothetical protein